MEEDWGLQEVNKKYEGGKGQNDEKMESRSFHADGSSYDRGKYLCSCAG